MPDVGRPKYTSWLMFLVPLQEVSGIAADSGMSSRYLLGRTSIVSAGSIHLVDNDLEVPSYYQGSKFILKLTLSRIS